MIAYTVVPKETTIVIIRKWKHHVLFQHLNAYTVLCKSNASEMREFRSLFP